MELMVAAGSASGGCKRPLESGVDKVLRAFPKIRLTGDPALDADRDARREMLLTIVKRCFEDDSHVLSLHSTLMKRLRVEEPVQHDDMLPPLSLMSRLPETDRIEAIAKLSDLSVLDVVTAKKQDMDADRQLFAFALGIGGSVKLPAELRPRKVFQNFVERRHLDLGLRLREFKAKGGIDARTGGLIWTKGCYQVFFDGEGKLSEVSHVGGDKVQVPEWCSHVSRSWVLQENWSDWNANIEMKPAPPIYLRSLFSEKVPKTGPFNVTLYRGGRSKELDMQIMAMHKDHMDSLAKLSGSSAQAGQEVKEHLTMLKKERVTAASTKARQAAMETLRATMEKRKIALTS